MTTVAIIGATGLVGSRILSLLLARDDVGRVFALGRRAVPVQHTKLESRVVDLQSAERIAAELPDGLDLAISAIGTTIDRAGSQAAFRAIDHDAVLALARAARSKGAGRFAVVSSLGANPRSRNFYLRTKGEMEQGLAQLGFSQLVVVRPSLIDDEGARTEHRLGERLALAVSRALFAIIGKTHRYAPISPDVIARALVRLALESSPEPLRIVESDALHALGAG
jgi:uncharacterized protein YbjT (DUF2867 family)